MKKYLLQDFLDFFEMLGKEWLNGRDINPPLRYPCIAIVTPGYENRIIKFVYLEDFKLL